MTTRRAVMLGLGGVLAAGPGLARPMALAYSGPAVQGGCLILHTAPRAPIFVDGEAVGQASEQGFAIVGFDRDAAPEATIQAGGADEKAVARISVAPGDFDIQRVNGLPQATVTPEDPRTLEKIAREAERKAIGFASNIDADHFRHGFAMPLKPTRISGRFGGQRILNGTPSRPHYGADLAAPKGTPIEAPCAGIVSFAETGLHYEGGLVMIDHGQGLVSAYLHMSRVSVEKGQTVIRGQKIGEVGSEGRATGPHLCWRMKWRGRNLDPMLLVGVTAPK